MSKGHTLAILSSFYTLHHTCSFNSFKTMKFSITLQITVRMVHCIYWVPLPTQLYFFLSSFKSANNLKTFESDYYLNDLTIFLYYQIQSFSVHVWIHPSGYINAFSVFHMHGFVIFLNHEHIQNLERSPGVCMPIEMSKFAIYVMPRIAIKFWYLYRLFLWHHCHLMTSICFILCKQANLIENVWGQCDWAIWFSKSI